MRGSRHTDDQGQILQFPRVTLVLDSSQALIDEVVRLVRGLFVDDNLEVMAMRTVGKLATSDYVPGS